MKTHAEESVYFGKGEPKPDDESVYPFRIDVPEAVLVDLKERLAKARITHEQLEDRPAFDYGFNMTALLKYRDYWLHNYDWRKAEAELNQLSHFKTQINGINLHFVHAKPPANKYARVEPILTAHGWPGSFHEFTKIIPMLTDPVEHGIKSEIAFEVVAPSIPGYGFSDAPSKSGLNQIITARMYKTLMNRLGYEKFFVQGGDWGSTIVGNVSRLYPDSVKGCHLNMMFSSRGPFLFKAVLGSISPRWAFSESYFHNYSIKNLLSFFLAKGGYFILQGNTPDTVGIGLNDSPIGLLAWVIEKFIGATNSEYLKSEDGRLEERYTMDELLTNLMIYWVNGNMLQAARYYKEMLSSKETQQLLKQYISVKTGYAACLNDAIPALPLELAKTIANVTHYTIMEGVGHFPAMEVPEQLARDVFKFAESLK